MGEEKMALGGLDWEDLLGLFWGPESQRHDCEGRFGSGYEQRIHREAVRQAQLINHGCLL